VLCSNACDLCLVLAFISAVFAPALDPDLRFVVVCHGDHFDETCPCLCSGQDVPEIDFCFADPYRSAPVAAVCARQPVAYSGFWISRLSFGAPVGVFAPDLVGCHGSFLAPGHAGFRGLCHGCDCAIDIASSRGPCSCSSIVDVFVLVHYAQTLALACRPLEYRASPPSYHFQQLAAQPQQQQPPAQVRFAYSRSPRPHSHHSHPSPARAIPKRD
jgi:hypothetical protein